MTSLDLGNSQLSSLEKDLFVFVDSKYNAKDSYFSVQVINIT
jgi:hypothetical protein